MPWRDCDAFRQENLSMNTTSNEAVKLYDCCLSQIVRWRDDPAYNGIDGTLKAMLEADPEFVMGHVLNCGLELIGNPLPAPNAPSPSVETLLALAQNQSPNLSKREMMSVEGRAGRVMLLLTCNVFFFFYIYITYQSLFHIDNKTNKQ